jgi:hypothetical protein
MQTFYDQDKDLDLNSATLELNLQLLSLEQLAQQAAVALVARELRKLTPPDEDL